MWVARKVTENQQREEQVPLLPLCPLPHIQHHSTETSITPSWGTSKAPPLYVTGAPRQKKMAQMKEQIKAPEKIQLSDEEIANLSDAQFKALVIKTLTELVESVRKVDEKMKPMLRESKENVQGTNSDEKETGTQTHSVDKKEKETSNQERMKKQEFKKNEERLRNLRDNFKPVSYTHLTLPTTVGPCRSRWSPYH